MKAIATILSGLALVVASISSAEAARLKGQRQAIADRLDALAAHAEGQPGPAGRLSQWFNHQFNNFPNQWSNQWLNR